MTCIIFENINRQYNQMELGVKAESCLRVDSTGFLVCHGREYLRLLKPHHQKEGQKLLECMIDKLGLLSAKAQALKQTITSALRFMGSDHRIYIKVKEDHALGFIKVGEKNLFYRDYVGNVKEVKATCVLDIYVHESCQRSGIGKEVFEKFLNVEQKMPHRLAYDRPSEKLLCFLKKHYGLVRYIPQNNNFVIYDRYFEKGTEKYHNLPSLVKQEQPREDLQISQPTKAKTLTKFNQMFENTKEREKKEVKDNSFQITGSRVAKHKNVTSEGFPLMSTKYDNPVFRTTSNAYGNYYKK